MAEAGQASEVFTQLKRLGVVVGVGIAIMGAPLVSALDGPDAVHKSAPAHAGTSLPQGLSVADMRRVDMAWDVELSANRMGGRSERPSSQPTPRRFVVAAQ